MTDRLCQLRRSIHPHAAIAARGRAGAPRASTIILGMVLVMLAVALVARALTFLFAAT